MKVYTAEKGDGTILLVRAEPGYSREQFTADVTLWLLQLAGDEAPHQVDLYEWENEETAGVWLTGQLPLAEVTWTQMAKDAHYEKIVWVYVGDGDGQYKTFPPDADSDEEGKQIAEAEMIAEGARHVPSETTKNQWEVYEDDEAR